MNRYILRLLVFAGLFVIQLPCWGQKIEGFLYEKSNTIPLSGAIVQYVELDSITLIDFSITDEKGYWMVGKQQVGLLKFSYLGMETQWVHTDSIRGEYRVLLRSSDNFLEQIIVKSEKTGIRVQGDTLVVDPNVFKRADDVNLGDLLQRIPGVEVEGGSVLYQGKSVSNLLLHNKDVLPQQSLALETIKIEDIEDIEVIQKYKEARERYDILESENTAINVNLKEAVLSKWIATIEAKAGYEEKAEAEASAIRINEKIGVTSYLRGNNTGSALLTGAEYLGFQPSLRRTLRHIGDDPDDLLPNEFQVKPNLAQNGDGLWATNVDWDKDSSETITGTLVLGRVRHINRSQIDRRYFLSGDSTTLTQNQTQGSYFANAGLNYQKEWSKQWFIEVDIPISSRFSITETRETGQLNTADFETSNVFDTKNIQLSPAVYINYKVSDSLVIKGTLESNYNTENEELSLTSLYPLFGSSTDIFDQDYRYQNHDVWMGLEAVKKEPTLSYGLSVHGYFQKENMENKLRPAAFSQIDNDLKKNALYFGGKLTIGKKEGLYYETDASLVRYNRTLQNQNQNDWTYIYSSMLRYEWKKTHFVFFRFKRDIISPNLPQSNTLFRAVDAQNVQRGSGTLDRLITDHSITINYFNYNLTTKDLLHFITSYSTKKNSYSQQNTTNNTYFERNHVQVPENTRTYNLYGKYAKRWRKLSGNMSYRFFSTSNYAVIENGFIPFGSDNHQFSLSVSSNDDHLNWDVRYHSSLTRFRHNGNNLGNLDVHQPGIGLSYSKNQLLVKTTLDYLITTSDLVQTKYWDWGIEASYELKRGKSKLVLEGVNLLNINSTMVNISRITPFSLEEEQYDLFPGYILLGVHYVF